MTKILTKKAIAFWTQRGFSVKEIQTPQGDTLVKFTKGFGRKGGTADMTYCVNSDDGTFIYCSDTWPHRSIKHALPASITSLTQLNSVLAYCAYMAWENGSPF